MQPWITLRQSVTDMGKKICREEIENPLETNLGRLQANTLFNYVLRHSKETEPNGEIATLAKQLPPSKSDSWKLVPAEVKASFQAAVSDMKEMRELKSGKRRGTGVFFLEGAGETEYLTDANVSTTLRWSASAPTDPTFSLKDANGPLDTQGHCSFAATEPDLPGIGPSASVLDTQTSFVRAPPVLEQHISPFKDAQPTLRESLARRPDKFGAHASSSANQIRAYQNVVHPNPRKETASNVTGPIRHPKSYSRDVSSRPPSARARMSHTSFGPSPYARPPRKPRSPTPPRLASLATVRDSSMARSELAEFVGFRGSISSGTLERHFSPFNDAQPTLRESLARRPSKVGARASSSADQTQAYHNVVHPNPRKETASNTATGPIRHPKSYSHDVSSRPPSARARMSHTSFGPSPYARPPPKSRSPTPPQLASLTTVPDSEFAEFVGFRGSIGSESNNAGHDSAAIYTGGEYAPCPASGNVVIVVPETSLAPTQSFLSPSWEQGYGRVDMTATAGASTWQVNGTGSGSLRQTADLGFPQVYQEVDGAQQDARDHFGGTAAAPLDGRDAVSYGSIVHAARTRCTPLAELFDGASSATGWGGIPAFEHLESPDSVGSTNAGDRTAVGDAPAVYNSEPQRSYGLPYEPYHPPPPIQESPMAGFYVPAGEDNGVVNPSMSAADPDAFPRSGPFWETPADVLRRDASTPSVVSEGSTAASSPYCWSPTPADDDVEYGPGVFADGEPDWLFQQPEGVVVNSWSHGVVVYPEEGGWNWA